MTISTIRLLSDMECQVIKKYILDNEERIKKLGPDNYPGTNNNSLTGRYPYFNYLNEPEIGNILIPKFIDIFKAMNLKLPIAIQCWANTFRKDEGIKYHRHGANNFKFICGNIFISGPTIPGTTYEINDRFIDIENEPGTLTLFDSNLGHMVRPNSSDEVRISMAMDVIENPVGLIDLNEYPNRYFIIESYDKN